ncbi:MAG: hypothetical protein U5K76_10855 [Woeseiaceae bacterium]|nr:hypothetical protein [Woeseiaceae bacterium]
MSAPASSLAALAAAMLLAAPPAPAQSAPGCEPLDEPQRRRPGQPPPEAAARCTDAGLRPAVWDELPPFAGLPDRWQVASMLGYPERWWDPYNTNNVLKGDRPAFGDDWFVSLNLVSDSTVGARRVVTPVGATSSPQPDTLDLPGDPDQDLFVQNVLLEAVLYKGDTVFKPPDYELRIIPVFNFSRVAVNEAGLLKVDPTAPLTRREGFVGIQGLFIDKHLRNVSERYDFDSLRVGIQPVTADFRGFLFQDSPVGVRLFGTRDNNRWQYNLGWFRRIEKDTNSALNDITENDLDEAIRDDDVFLFNLYRQDFPVLGFTSQVVVAHNRNREDMRDFVDDNGFLVRPAALGVQVPRRYDVTYAGLNGDGHFGRWNLTASAYFAFGDEEHAVFTGRDADIRAAFAAAEVSRDFDWLRLRGTLVYGSGDDDPYDDRATGFDAILENPLIAGADTSFWIREAVPLIGGGRVTVSGQNGLLNSLRPSKFQGQSNFTNPGVILAGVGADLDLTPKLRLTLNANQLWFDDTAVIEVARNQGRVARDIGQDLSLHLIWRPLTSQNIVLRVAASALLPGAGYENLFGDDVPYSVFANLVLSY